MVGRHLGFQSVNILLALLILIRGLLFIPAAWSVVLVDVFVLLRFYLERLFFYVIGNVNLILLMVRRDIVRMFFVTDIFIWSLFFKVIFKELVWLVGLLIDLLGVLVGLIAAFVFFLFLLFLFVPLNFISLLVRSMNLLRCHLLYISDWLVDLWISKRLRFIINLLLYFRIAKAWDFVWRLDPLPLFKLVVLMQLLPLELLPVTPLFQYLLLYFESLFAPHLSLLPGLL